MHKTQFSDKGPSMKWVCFPKFYSPLANSPWLRITPQSSLYVIYCLILTAWQWLMIFTCIPVQLESNKSPLRKRLWALLLWEISYLSSPSRSCLGRLILIHGGGGGAHPWTTSILFMKVINLLSTFDKWWSQGGNRSWVQISLQAIPVHLKVETLW